MTTDVLRLNAYILENKDMISILFLIIRYSFKN